MSEPATILIVPVIFSLELGAVVLRDVSIAVRLNNSIEGITSLQLASSNPGTFMNIQYHFFYDCFNRFDTKIFIIIFIVICCCFVFFKDFGILT